MELNQHSRALKKAELAQPLQRGTAYNYKNKLSGKARERGQAIQSHSCNPINST